ncbi:hypothetical protein ACP70R_046157 [Stipagrostis hirtigluma subsp. patula]
MNQGRWMPRCTVEFVDWSHYINVTAPMATSVVVRKSSPVVVRPSSEPMTATSATMELTSLDKSCVKLVPKALLVYEHPIHDAHETIKRALSRALVHYYPISGRIAAGPDGDGELHIQCNGEGVAFVAASADCALKEAVFFDHRSPPGARTAALLDELAVLYPAGRCGPTDPLLLMQVTVFSCGGFVLGVTWNHGIADGAGMAQFLHAVGELARGSPSPSVAPVRRCGGSLPGLPPSTVACKQLVMGFQPLNLARLAIVIPSSLISRVRAEFRDRSHGQPSCTKFEAVIAVLWQCRTRATMSDPHSPALLCFTANVRKHVGAMDGYYGNCVTMQLVTATSTTVANADITDLVGMIKRAKNGIPEQFSKNGSYSQQLQGIDRHQQLQYNTLTVSSWQDIGFEEADFGGGTPATVTYYGQPTQPCPFCVISPACKGKDGSNEVWSACVKEDHADAFLGELARFM